MICENIVKPEYLFMSSDAPSLLYYSHVPAIVLPFILGFLIYKKDTKSILNRIFFLLSTSFSLWTLINLIVWTNNDIGIIMYAWMFFGLIYAVISVYSIYFTHIFLFGNDLGKAPKIVFSLILLPVILITPTMYNLDGFNYEYCGASGHENIYFLSYYTILGILSMVWIAVLFFKKNKEKSKTELKKNRLFVFGIELFLFSFFFSSFLASTLNDYGVVDDYSLEFYGIFGMLVFLMFIGYLITKFEMFNLKVITTNVLVFVLLAAFGSVIFIDNIDYVRVVTSLTMIFAVFVGWMLIRGVRSEVRQRQEISRLNKRLENLLHFISHEIKGYLTKSTGVFSMIADGEYGEVNEKIKEVTMHALKDNRMGVDTIMLILNSMNLKLGTLKFDKNIFDIKSSINVLVDSFKTPAEQREIKLSFDIDEKSDYSVLGDKEYIIKHVYGNLIDNSIKYTPVGGWVKIKLFTNNNMVVFQVSDNGIGISDADRERLFTEGGKGEKSSKINVNSTGYGLYFCKGIVTAHNGKIYAESEGEGKGSIFTVELPKVINS